MSTTTNVSTANLNSGDNADKMRSAVGASHLNASDAHTEDNDDNFNTTSQAQVVVGPIKKTGHAVVTLGKRTPEVSKLPDVVKTTMDQIANTPGVRQQMRGQQNSRNYNENK
jgi:hypothetical protein